MTYRVFVAGSGGIGRAVAILLQKFWEQKTHILFGDRKLSIAEEACQEVAEFEIELSSLSAIEMAGDWEQKVANYDILLDCLPGRLAPKMAKIAIANGMHYVNLTEYVAETKEILALSQDAKEICGITFLQE